MIHLLNRKEICLTYSLEEQARVREILRNHHIHYTVYTKNLTSPSPMDARRNDTIGLHLDRCIEYKIYVHKKDYEATKWLLRSSSNTEQR